MLQSRLQTAISIVFPPRCLGCGSLVESDFGLCGSCWRDTPFLGGCQCDGCGLPLLGEADGPVYCDDCMAAPPVWDRGWSALRYEGSARKLVLALKHGDRQEIAKPAAKWMAEAINGSLPQNTLICPVPLHWTRLFKRRYNQSALLAKALASELDAPWCPDLLRRTKRTISLDGLDKEARKKVLSDTITVHPKRQHLLTDRPILIVDDVMTSGATLREATRACLAAGSGAVNVVALARVAKDA